MPDKIVIKPSDGSIIFTNASNDVIGSIDTGQDSGNTGDTDLIVIDKARFTNGEMDGGSYTSA
jgi:hypothetical protein